MPIRLRVAHEAQLRQQRPGQPVRSEGVRGKARLRKYRRKARFLLAIRKLRAKNDAWLETHIWHAKRFRMADLGGLRVAEQCNDRGLRSSYKAAAHASVVHDSSYKAVLQVRAESKQMLKGLLRRRLSFEDGRRVTTDPVTSGTRHVKDVVLHGEDGRAVAPVDVLWRPGDAAEVWVWAVPGVTQAVQAVFKARFAGEAEGGWTVGTVGPTPLCFSVFGPRAGIVLAAVLNPARACKEFTYITQVRSPACVPSSCVFAGRVQDPRAAFPPKTMGKHHGNIRMFGEEMWDTFRTVEDSELWDEERRQYWKEFIPSGTKDARKGPPANVPFMLLQLDSGTQRGFGSGWDLIVPAGWGMAFWMSLMYSNGNRAIGQNELRALRLETGQPVFPEDFADTVCGCTALREEEKILRETYLRRPKSKRVNYTLNRVESPMYPALGAIARTEATLLRQNKTSSPPQKKPRSRAVETVAEGSAVDDRDVRIIRSRKTLQSCLGEAAHILLPNGRGQKTRRRGRCSSDANPYLPSPLTDETLSDCSSFVRVTLDLPGKGVPTKNGLICAPTEAELSAMRKISNAGNCYGGFRETLARKGEGRPTRDLIGYVTLGGFSLTRGMGVANGIIAVSAVKRIVQQNGLFQPNLEWNDSVASIGVFFRNVSSLQYRPAFVHIKL